MSKKIILLLAMVWLTSSQFITAQAFEEGQNNVSIGYGYEVFSVKKFFTTYEGYDDFTVTGFGPIVLKYEHGISDKIGFGLNVGYGTAKVSWTDSYLSTDENGNDVTKTYTYDYKFNKITAQARLNWHLGDNDKLDPYLGFGIGYKSSKWTLETNDDFFDELTFKGLPISMSASVGCRYYFTDNIGIFGEIGMGHGFMQGGLQIKF
ncbi:MAG: hypothetical protein ACKVOK_15390 [Flavobacteriales bacterium]